MKLKTYHAYSMAEALVAVKRDLGDDAVILHTRTFKRGGIFGFRRKTVVEVTATPAAAAPASTAARSPRFKLKDVQASRAYASANSLQAVAPAPPSLEEDRERTRRLALAMEESHKRRAAAATETEVENNSKPRISDSKLVTSVPAEPVEKAARRFLLTTPGVARDETSSTTIAPPQPAMHDELAAIKQMVGQVLQRQVTSSGQPTPAMPPQLFEIYLQLISQDISDELAEQIVRAVRDEIGDEDCADENIIRPAVLRHLAGFIPVANEAFSQQSIDGRPLIIALVGPTGVGKTTTLAKLAATFKLRHGKSVGLITADTYRIAAVDQLRTYADIIDLPLQVALTPAEMKHAINSFGDRDVILIDTAGRSQRDSGRIAELKRFIAAANPHEVHLVLSGTAGEKVLLQEAEAFSAVGVHKIVLTKLDEAVSFGMLVNVVRQVGKQLSFVTTGQEVPDHLEVGRADRLAELVLCGCIEKCGSSMLAPDSAGYRPTTDIHHQRAAALA